MVIEFSVCVCMSHDFGQLELQGPCACRSLWMAVCSLQTIAFHLSQLA